MVLPDAPDTGHRAAPDPCPIGRTCAITLHPWTDPTHWCALAGLEPGLLANH